MSTDPDKVYSSANLQDMNDDFLAARLGEVFPDGPPVAPDASTRELDARLTGLRNGMMISTASSSSGGRREPPPSRSDAGIGPPPVAAGGHVGRPSLTSAFETTAPDALLLMHAAAEALRRPTLTPDEAGAALEAQYGIDEAGRLAEDALAYANAYVPPAMLANLRARGVLNSPGLICDAALIWRRHRTDQ